MAAVRQSLSLSLPYLTVTQDSDSSAEASNNHVSIFQLFIQ